MNVKPTLTPEILVPRLGDYLLEKGIISKSVLDRALKIQRGKKIAQSTSTIDWKHIN